MAENAENRRAHPRVELLAQVQVKRDLEVHIMEALNISIGGIFIQGQPEEYPDLAVGTTVELMIFDPDSPDGTDVTLKAHVVRREVGENEGMSPGFGLRFADMDGDKLEHLCTLISKAEGA